MTFLLLVPVPLLAYLAPIEGWTVATAYEGTVLGGFLVLCLGIALGETIFARHASPMFATHAFWLSVGVIALIVAGPIYTYELEFLGRSPLAGANLAAPLALACFARVALQTDPFPIAPRRPKGRTTTGGIRGADAIVFDERRPKYALRTAEEEAGSDRPTLIVARDPPKVTTSVVAHGGCCDRDRRHPGPIVRDRGGSPFRLLLSRAWNPPRGRDDGPCPGPPGLLVAGPDGTLRRRRGARGPWAPSPVRGRVERPSLVRGPRGRGDRPRQVAVPSILRNGGRTGRDRRGLLEREGDGGTVRGRGRRERARAPVRESPSGLRRATGGRGRRR